MVTPVLLDVLLIAILALFALLGAKRGFVLTLCSLVAVIVALIGATIVSDALAPKVAEFLQPRIEQSIRAAQDAAFFNGEQPTVEDGVMLFSWLEPIKEMGGVYEWAAQGVEDALKAGQTEAARQLYATIATTVAQRLAHAVLFAVSFVLLLIAWAILSHALDLVAKLPVLNTLNNTLGAALGLVKGLVVCYIAAWVLCSVTQTIPPQMVEETRLLSLLTGFSLLG